MTIEFGPLQQADLNGFEAVVQGDGTTSVLVVNLSISPCDVNFNGHLPSVLNVQDPEEGMTATATIATVPDVGDEMTITFSSPPPADNTIGVVVAYEYASL